MRFGPLTALAAVLSLVAAAAARAEPAFEDLARDLVGPDQGVYVEAEDGTVLAAVAEAKPVHPASVTKVATTLALLERLGPDHRFETRFVADGPVRDGRLAGDLVVDASRDPFLVSEHATAIAGRLHAEGVTTISGDLVVHGPLLFNWKPDPEGRRLRAALSGHDEGAAPGPRDALIALHFGAAPVGDSAPAHEHLLATHRSPTLREIVKALNGYSNNVFHPLSDSIGGPAAVQALARDHIPPAMATEVVIENGAGGGETNRMSPRAVVAVLAALERTLATHRLDLPDVLPVSGTDAGTLRERFLGPGERGTVVGKTGTFGDVGASALVGVLRTRRYGRVRFAILNHWVPVPEARRRQDAFVEALLARTDAEPWPYVPSSTAPVGAAQLE